MEENVQVIRIERSQGWVALQLKELWAYRELLYFLIWRDVKVRYKQTALGVAWAIIQPVFTMIVFSLFFGRLGKIPSGGFLIRSSLMPPSVPWTFFSHGLTSSVQQLSRKREFDQESLFSKTFCPDRSSGFRRH